VKVQAPTHLSREAKGWYRQVCGEFALEEHHLRLLQVCAESWDLGQRARQELENAGSLTYTDRFGGVRPLPQISIMRDAKTQFMRALRELGLDIEPPRPEAGRPPRAAGGYH
jgi:phage terminase small subunit